MTATAACGPARGVVRSLLLSRTWTLSRSDGSLVGNDIRFGEDGRLEGRGLSERSWKVDDQGWLWLFFADGGLSTRFDRSLLLRGGAVRLFGTFVFDEKSRVRHQLDTQPVHLPHGESRLNISSSLTGTSDTLLVVANSAGRPSDGLETSWEFFDLPRLLGVDHVHLAETQAPTVYYLDKIARIESILRATAGSGYRTVILVGMSSGGYLSMLMAELLAAALPDVSFHSVSVNPQTSYEPAHTAFVTGIAKPGFPPTLVDPRGIGLTGPARTDLASVVSAGASRRSNVRHTVFYDRGNVAERFYCSLVADLPGVSLRPSDLGVPHFEGCVTIFRSGVVQDRVTEIIFGAPDADGAG